MAIAVACHVVIFPFPVSVLQHDPEKVGLRCTRNPLMIPHNDILQGYDPRTHPHTHLCR